ncbi:SDR family oxidoreductase [Chlorobium ferrooxidans]|uniref:NAD-dependent epimerase/dehydratase:3-beta hydroxysteroid dehydrogenase/isomerase:dTDP-4-dehydrorhamnose reductase n=1 Tax=Chlorobium ferrooxidans DSM 13031 TaxID=377431 RepID=Q0YTU2_9CHLB|nr:SDR family oxidoreductase [Chlorobium ferrooxidans]EAT59809.1 NAD-dependent epimerase/dehydratase:3-beta hydroxysteroid dehydrogenase/isomerase:dTDP-4-dehydrorhamnose reductase [Chlorobium ferrooxidans DSM 13031]
MKLVVTGAIGHIGSYVVRDLALQFPGAEIVMIDNMMTQRFPSLFNLPSTGTYRFIEGDVTSLDLRPVLEGAQAVIHLAAITDAAGSFDKAAQLEANNYQATLKVASACVETGARLIALSSTSVYGTQNAVVAEDCSEEELKPQSPYALTKLKEEQMVRDLHVGKGLKSISCRFGTIFGASPGMRFHTAVNKFCWQAVMGMPITVWSTAYDQKRPYLDLFDASRALAYIIRNDLFDGRIYNILTHNATVRQIVDTIREFVPDLQVSFVDNQIMNQLSYEVSCERFLSTGFVFAGDLRRGVGETISLLRNANQ